MIVELTESESEQASAGLTGAGFAAAVLGVGAATIAICTAPAWGAIGGVLTIGALGANAIDSYIREAGGGSNPTARVIRIY